MHLCRLLQVVHSIRMEVAGVEPASSGRHIGFIPIRSDRTPGFRLLNVVIHFLHEQPHSSTPSWRAAVLPILFYPSSVSWHMPRQDLPHGTYWGGSAATGLSVMLSPSNQPN